MNDAYPLKAFSVHETETLLAIMRLYPLATLISGSAGNAQLTLIPLLVQQDKDGQMVLSGHLDRNNEHAARLVPGAPVSFQFVGPDHYASPDLYPDPQLPGWLYVSVSGDGEISGSLNESELRALLIESTDIFGTGRQGFSLAGDDQRIDRFVRYIKGFRIRVSGIRGIAKLAQDKGPVDAAIAKDFLASRDNSSSKELFERILHETL